LRPTQQIQASRLRKTNKREREREKKSGGENEEEKTGNEMSFGVCVCARVDRGNCSHGAKVFSIITENKKKKNTKKL
jgi:hypothetical protein